VAVRPIDPHEFIEKPLRILDVMRREDEDELEEDSDELKSGGVHVDREIGDEKSRTTLITVAKGWRYVKGSHGCGGVDGTDWT
jgi:hypothetical protein